MIVTFFSLLIILPFLTVFASFGFGGPSPVEVAKVELSALRETRQFSGTTLAWKTSKVGSPSEGLVIKRGIFYGVAVSDQQVILELDTSVQMARLEALKAEQEALYQVYAAKQGGSRSEEIEAARSEHRRYEAEFTEAKLQLQRMKGLLAQKAASQEQYDQAFRNEQVSGALVQNAKSRLELLESGERKEDILSAGARWKAALARVEEMQRVIEKMKIKAPFAGVAGEVFVEEGDWISTGDSIAQLFDSTFIDVVVLVPEELIHEVALKSTASCHFKALPGNEIQGLVVSKGPSTTQAGRTVPLVVRLPNKDGLVKPGMSVETELQVGEQRQSLWIDKDAILRGGPMGPMVYTYVDGTVQAKPVKLGRVAGSKVEALEGLNEGDQVVIRGNERLRPGAEVVLNQNSAAK